MVERIKYDDDGRGDWCPSAISPSTHSGIGVLGVTPPTRATHRWHTGRIPTCLTGGAMVVERGGRGEGAWAELDGRQSNDVTITVGPGMVLPDVALQLP